MINLEWFRTFKVIYEAGTLSAAAQALFISQPGVSLHLSSLEAFTGYRLFDRDTRKMIATDRGTFLYNFIIEHMNKLEEAENIFNKKWKLEKPTVSVGMSMEVFQYILESHVPELPFNLTTRFGDYSQMLHELNNGTLDLILTPQKGTQHNLEYTPFSKERIILICGGKTDTTELDSLILKEDREAVKDWLTTQLWYSTAADMEPLKRFWSASFNTLPAFRPNYIVPYYGAILRCLSNNKGFAVVPDFLCRQEIEKNLIKLAWEGSPPVEDTLYFGKRKITAFPGEIKQLEVILSKNWPLNEDKILASS
ncbi:DNA-binding transcriptional LysR family regulator [Mucilaginibacter sp. SG538B]|uniref:LysR family transcriptional regulator n=1 Tax=Mucilaginibacter sp. SG538B TaxID=2587021 RepID=UPI00159E0B0E|nr:LysR family transcriptional regulator [Mucilaginibacter sp. SG538B]NVM66714.1 DNA-binding transcriptional LysR family regulator [Mucilaginibacter sp. SG538B]